MYFGRRIDLTFMRLWWFVVSDYDTDLHIIYKEHLDFLFKGTLQIKHIGCIMLTQGLRGGAW